MMYHSKIRAMVEAQQQEKNDDENETASPSIFRSTAAPVATVSTADASKLVAVPLTIKEVALPEADPLRVLEPAPFRVIVRVVLSVPVEQVPVKAPA